MPERIPCCMADAARKVRRITLSNGVQIGIIGLEPALTEVRCLGRTDEPGLKAELMERIKAHNYVPPGAEPEYAQAIYEEYLRLYDKQDL